MNRRDARMEFVAIWCAVGLGVALIALGIYLSISVHGTSLIVTAGLLVYLISTRALRSMFGAAVFATGTTRSRALAAFIALNAIFVGALVALVAQFFLARSLVFWWDIPLSVVIFITMLGASVLSYRYGIDYRRRDRPAPPAMSVETTRGADASHPRPSVPGEDS